MLTVSHHRTLVSHQASLRIAYPPLNVPRVQVQSPPKYDTGD